MQGFAGYGSRDVSLPISTAVGGSNVGSYHNYPKRQGISPGVPTDRLSSHSSCRMEGFRSLRSLPR